ncbi:type 1 glutamine amidotransferase domain-containing protein [Aquirufa sp. 2-AUSEE-184A6]|jgi:putative intracellular protease/amidase|uniref:Type 1 glutamine amidotransferase domain-containing protein n=1 Tax=Aquirufa novilacunae TaxID=3139305 RepID=A0ABW8SVF7_9BACT
MKNNILIVVTSVSCYKNTQLKTGLWLSEITHFYSQFKEQGCDITIASPQGGDTPVDPESLNTLFMDSVSKKCWQDETFRKLLQNTKCLKDVSGNHFDVVYLTGGHGTMYDFPYNENLQNIIKVHYEKGKIIAAICHGVCGLLNVKLSNSKNLISGKKITGFNWFEESLARRKKVVPFNLENEIKKRTNYYKKAVLPMTSLVVVDENLITGQNPFSSKEIANIIFKEVKNLNSK